MLLTYMISTFGLDKIDRNIALGDRSPVEIVAELINILLGFLGILAVIMIIFSGLMIMLSGGNEDRRQRGYRTLMNAIIGIILILSSYAIVQFVINALSESAGSRPIL